MTVAFFMGVFRDQVGAQKRIVELRKWYGDVQILSISDGVVNEGYSTFCQQHGVLLENGERLKLSKFGGAWTQRRLQFFMDKSDADVLVKIDPDTRVQAYLEFPVADVFAGLCPDTLPEIGINGSCLGISRPVVEKVLQSGLLADPRYKGVRFASGLPSGDIIVLEDAILTDVFRKLGITVTEVPNAIFYTRPGVSTEGLAFVHPEKC